jgi:hypothetical protein
MRFASLLLSSVGTISLGEASGAAAKFMMKKATASKQNMTKYAVHVLVLRAAQGT